MTTYVGNPPKSVYGVQDATNVIADFVTDGTQHSYDILNDFIANPQLNFRVSSGTSTTPFLSIVHSEDSTTNQYSTQYTHQIGTATPPAPAIDANTYIIPSNSGNTLLSEGVIAYEYDSVFPIFLWKTNGYSWSSANHRRTIYNGIYNNTLTQHPTGFTIFNGEHATNPIPAGIRIVITTPQATNLILPLEYSAPRANILINSDFAINQRSYTGAALPHNSFGYDRWDSNAAGTTMSASGGVLTIDNTTASTVGKITQRVEKGQLVTGDIYTLSWEGTARASVWYANGSALNWSDTGTLTFIASSSVGDINELIVFEGDGVTLSKVKLEQGASTTPWEKPDKATELARCQRYFERIGDASNNKQLGSGYFWYTTLPKVTVHYSRKRTNPTVTPTNLLGLRIGAHSNQYSFSTNVTANDAGLTACVLQVTVPLIAGTTLGEGCECTLQSGNYLDIDAEL